MVVVFDGNEDDIIATAFLKKIFERKKKKG
jgi:hypothetical protein